MKVLLLCYILRDRHTVLGSAPKVDRGGCTQTLFATFQPSGGRGRFLCTEMLYFWFIACVDILIFYICTLYSDTRYVNTKSPEVPSQLID